MKKTTNLLFVLALLASNLSYSQNKTKDLSLDKGNINEQFDYVITKSSRFENYKVIKFSWINQLKSHVNDSINKLKSDLNTTKQEIVSQKIAFNDLQKELDDVNTNLVATTSTKDNILFFGMPLKKVIYKNIMWALVALLTIALLFFIYQFKNSNSITKRTLKEIDELESEYSISKTRALEREQVLNRKLQDELNKQKK